YRIARIWCDSLIETKDIPDIAHRGKFYPIAENLEKLKSAVNELLNNQPSYQWITKAGTENVERSFA
ncbi:MAG: hypothetical protein D6780_05765, partial [Candidatus Dadabacteria bacterium]